jgi:hypothetical protein
MTDISITAANVIAGAGARRVLGTAGATIIAGKVVYLDASVSKYKLADNNSVTAALRSPAGIALNGASDGQPLIVHEAGPLAIGATLEPGAIYLLSDTPGGICPVADLTPGEYPTILGIATSPTVLQVDIQESGVAFS